MTFTGAPEQQRGTTSSWAMRASLSQRWHLAFFRFRLGGCKVLSLEDSCNLKATSSCAPSTPPSTCILVWHRSEIKSSTSLVGVGHGRVVLLGLTIARTWPCSPLSASVVACEQAATASGSTGQRWLHGFLTAPTVKGTSSASMPRPVHNDVLDTNPWLAVIFGASRPAPVSARARGSGAHASDRERNDQSNDGARGVAATEDDIFEELQHHRGFLAAGCGDDVGGEHFSVAIRGSAWIAAHVGAVVDGVRVYASTVHGATHSLLHSVTFSLKLYGEDTCTILEVLGLSDGSVFSTSC